MTVMARRRPRPERALRFSRRALALAALGAVSLVLFSILVPLQAVLYGTPLPLAFILGAALCAAPLLAISRPWKSVNSTCTGMPLTWRMPCRKGVR
jgi:hypothetical protein